MTASDPKCKRPTKGTFLRRLDGLGCRLLGGVALAGAGLLVAGAVQPPEKEQADLAAKAGSAGAVSFDRDIRPLFANQCFKCHGPDEATRQAGLRLDRAESFISPVAEGRPVVIPGDAARSRLMRRLTTEDHDDKMPPPEVSANGMSDEDIAKVRAWIDAGAKWEEHWSYLPLVTRPIPADLPGARAEWCAKGEPGTIDRWVLDRLRREGLEPSGPAERGTLLRRVSLDLVGLPPTIEELDAFENDQSPDAYERAVDRLLASARFGEKWARWWLDLARYADTKGYEKDERRTIWPYRDWVIRAFNDDMPLSEFARQQLAGDMPHGREPTQSELIATAFHRNTMTNDEGGTDDEEFRSAAVIDRVNTTMEVFQGTTMACVQCHTHKYDPLKHTDYYRLLALFNNTADADREDDAPTMRVGTDADTRDLARLHGQIDAKKRTLDDRLGELWTLAQEQREVPKEIASAEPTERFWLDDVLPAGVKTWKNDDGKPWPWTTTATGGTAPNSGRRCWTTTYPGTGQYIISEAQPLLHVSPGDEIGAWVYLDPKNPPKAVMFQWFSKQKGWMHRAYWGTGDLPWDKDKENTPARQRIGDLPTPGVWTKLKVPASAVDLEGLDVAGWAFSQHGGSLSWDSAGLVSRAPIDETFRRSFDSWLSVERGREGPGLGDEPFNLRPALAKPEGEWTAAERSLVQRYFVRRVHPETAEICTAVDVEIAALLAELAPLEARSVSLPIMRELAGGERRATHRFERGSFLSPAEAVEPGIPEVLAAATGNPKVGDRGAFSAWLFAADNPLTARVLANRVWEQVWGVGIVETLEDFGVQGSPPSHPELLDHLAVSLRGSGWRLKGLLREIVMSSTYRQGSQASAALIERDPTNRLLGRGARFRIDGETIRDAALTASGLLSAKMFGPPVFPPQPPGLWIMIYNGDDWLNSKGEDRY